MSLRRPKRNSWEYRALNKLRQQQANKAQPKPSSSKTMTYVESVLIETDQDGLLTVKDAMQLMREHNTSLYQLEQQGYKGGICNAQELLWFLGY
jgi:hypothetical protein